MENNTTKKILIVDDEPDILEFLSYNFSRNGFAVMTALNGEEGLKRAVSGIPDLIISDILMPVMDGVQFCRHVRASEDLRDKSFIFLTAVNDDYKMLYAMSSGGDQYVSKPVHFKALLSLVEEMLSVKKAG